MEDLERLAVFTVAYPGVEPFLAPFHRSLREQTDLDFDLWVALDAVTPVEVVAAVGRDPGATWVVAEPGATPAEVRQRAFELLVERYDGIVFVDADDLLAPTRVAAARRGLASAGLTVCALDLVDAGGAALGARMGLPAGGDPDAGLPRTNAFGLSNTAYRSAVLERCLPVPASARAVDWFLATRAWLAGATIAVDPEPRMRYRQHGANMTVVRPPFREAQVRRDAAHVAAHLALVRSAPGERPRPDRLAAVAAAAAEVDAFTRVVVDDPHLLGRYVRRLEALTWPSSWWAHVAHPSLRAWWADRRA